MIQELERLEQAGKASPAHFIKPWLALGELEKAAHALDRTVKPLPVLYLLADSRFEPLRAHPSGVAVANRFGLHSVNGKLPQR